MPRKAKILGPEQYLPVEAVLLAIDPSKKCSGYALFVPEYDEETEVFLNSYEIEAFGTVKEREQESRREIVERAAAEADDAGLPLVVVAENWSAGGRKMTYAAFVGLGEGWGLWRAELLACGIPDHCVVRPLPQQWRARVLGWISKGDSKRTAQQFVMDCDLLPFKVSHDIADAVCLGRCGAYSAEAVEVVTKEKRRFKRKDRPDSYLEYDEGDEDDAAEALDPQALH